MKMNKDFDQLYQKAMAVKQSYNQLNIDKGEKKWTYREYVEGLVGDVGTLMKLVMAKENFRGHKEEDLDKAITHEVIDCLWAILVIADELEIDLEKKFPEEMDKLLERIDKEGH
jgi:NTP pyrophosphatase (non-canonical NTP hydrolase)